MSDVPRYATLRDYLRVIRRNRWLILAIVAAFASVAFVISITQTERYEARSSLAFRDLGSDLNLLGGSAPPQSSIEQRAAATAQLISRPEIVERVSERLGGSISPQQIEADVRAEVGGISNLVIVVAQATEAELAARLANSIAAEASRVAQREEARRIDRAIASLEREAGPETGGELSFSDQVIAEQIIQLETVKQIARPIQVAERAQVPSGPVSPRPLRSTFLGALLGIAVALALAFARDSLDRRFRGARDVHDELGLPVLGRVSERAMGMAGFASNGHAPIDEADLEAFRMLRTNLEFLASEHPVRSVVVTSGLPGEGKSTVAAGLASAAAMAGKRTLLLECDLRRPTLADRLGINRAPGLTDYLEGSATPQDVLQLVPLAGGRSNGSAAGVDGEPGSAPPDAPSMVCVAAGGPTSRPAELLGSDRFRELLNKVAKVYDMVVIDTSPLLSAADALQLVPQVDGVIVCMRMGQTTRDEARAAKAALNRLPPRSMGAVLTGLRPADGEDYEYYYRAYTH
jgi:tyrosine-protein kinase